MRRTKRTFSCVVIEREAIAPPPVPPQRVVVYVDIDKLSSDVSTSQTWLWQRRRGGNSVRELFLVLLSVVCIDLFWQLVLSSESLISGTFGAHGGRSKLCRCHRFLDKQIYIPV